MIVLTRSSVETGYIQLKYDQKSAIISASASSLDFGSAVESMIGSTVMVSRSSHESDMGFTWTITFPSLFGRAHLVHALACTHQCSPLTTRPKPHASNPNSAGICRFTVIDARTVPQEYLSPCRTWTVRFGLYGRCLLLPVQRLHTPMR